MFPVPFYLKIAVCLLPFAAFYIWYGDTVGISHYTEPMRVARVSVVIALAAMFLFSPDYARNVIRSQAQSSNEFVWSCHALVCLLASLSAVLCLFALIIRLSPAQTVSATAGGVEKTQSRGSVHYCWLVQAQMPELVGQRLRISAQQYRRIRQNPEINIRVRRNFAGMSVEVVAD